MSTPLPGSYNDDFEQSKNTIFIKRQIVNYRLLDSIERLNNMTQRKFL